MASQSTPSIHHRNKFGAGDHDVLARLVLRYGTSSWRQIAFEMPDRNARQCRDRWNHYLAQNQPTGSWPNPSQTPSHIRCVHPLTGSRAAQKSSTRIDTQQLKNEETKVKVPEAVSTLEDANHPFWFRIEEIGPFDAFY
jgi:hypothetical protein